MRQAFQVMAAMACLALPAQAAAQGATGSPVMDVGQVLRQAEQPFTRWEAPPSPLTRLPKTARKWIAEETARQAEAPRAPLDLMLAADRTMAKDITRLSKRERINPNEILTAVVLKILIDAEAQVAKAPAGPDTTARLAQAAAHRKEVVGWASQTSLYMAAM